MDLTKIELTAKQITGNDEGRAIVTAITPGYEYQDGKKTDNVTYMALTSVFPNNSYEKLKVKVLDMKLPLTAEQLKAQGEKKVKFKNLRGKVYRTGNGDYAVSATADSLEVLP